MVDVVRSFAIFPGDSAGDIFKRRGHGNPLAADARIGLNGRVHALAGGKAVPQDAVRKGEMGIRCKTVVVALHGRAFLG